MNQMKLRENVNQPLFFKPNTEFVKWLIEYANGRTIIDAGCGEKFILSQQILAAGGTKVVAIDPQLNYQEYEFMRIKNKIPLEASFHPLVGAMEDYEVFYSSKAASGKILLVFARPCHSNWVENTLSKKAEGVEALYITKPENLEKYNDLGRWKSRAMLVEHKGSSAEKEVVYSIK